jgi:shikimate kinase
MDSEIEKERGKSIPSIFEEEGEQAFRSLESEMLHNLPKSDCVVITGGGLPVSDGNRNYMKNTGVVVYLKTSLESILSRLESKGEREKRPLLEQKNAEEIAELHDQRASYYEECDLSISTDNKSPRDVAEQILMELGLNRQ